MSYSKEILSLAGALAAGEITENQLQEQGLDDSVIRTIVSLAATGGAGLVAGMVTNAVLDNEIAKDVTDVLDDGIDTVLDVVDDFNPFSGW